MTNEKITEDIKKKVISRQRKWQIKKQQQGICVICGKRKIKSSGRCIVCINKFRKDRNSKTDI